MEGLIAAPFFASLPGSARVQLVDTLMTLLAQELVWSPLSPKGDAAHITGHAACCNLILLHLLV